MDSRFSSAELITIFEIARIALASVPDVVEEELDISDSELQSIRDKLQDFLNK